MNLHLKKSKIKLLFSFFIILSLGYIIYTILYEKYKSQYNINTNVIEGKIIAYKINGDSLQLEIKAKEKLIAFYTFKTEEEKEWYQNTLCIGDIYNFYGIIEVPSTNTNFNLFSYKKYLLSKKIYYIMQIDTIELHKKNNSLPYTIKNKIYKSIQNKSTFAYLALFLFGDSSILDSNMLQMYRNCGISHLIAISGMHISLFSMVLLFLLKWISSNHLKYVLVIGIMWFYAFLVGFTPSIIRAVSSFTIISILKLINKQIKPIYILLFVALVLLLYNPFYIYHTGFLFSFSISFFIMLSKDILDKAKNYVMKIFLISLISFFTGIPIIANSFYEVNLFSSILNIIFVPLISYIVFPLALLSFIVPVLDPIFEIAINILEELVYLANNYFNLPFIIPKMNLILIVLYYLFLGIVIYYKKYKCISVILLFLLFHSNYKIFQYYPIITVMDVGQGDCILIELPHNQGNLLIDTGGKISYEEEEWKSKNIDSITNKTIIPYLKSRGIYKLKYLIITHGDYDHMGEAINLVNNFNIEKVIFNCGEFNELEQELIEILDNKKTPYYSCVKELNIDDNKLYFLNNGNYDNENDNSSVVYTELNNYKFLFMGDAGVDVEEDLIKRYTLQNIDVLKIGHHGSKTSSSKKFINEINPKYSIISVGKNNRYGHPNDNVLESLEDSKIYRTDQDGSIMFKINNDKLRIETCSS